jgi:predicted alpha/beta hydrolase
MSLSRESEDSYSSFTYCGRRIGYGAHGSGPRAIVLIHGLLMDSRMYTRLAPTLAADGHRVIVADMLGHGASDQPHEMTAYSMPQFGRDVIALLDHLELPQAVIGHPSDPIRPFSDADRLAHELPNAQLVTASSMLEWRLRPARLDRALLTFLDEVWRPQRVAA